jgi:hypothetical protein
MKPTGYVIYDGPSKIDGARIVVIVLTSKSSNRKTGDEVQTYIIRPDLSPLAAVRVGADVSICGDCKHRGDGTGKGRTCYVTLIHGPSVVFRQFAAGKYPTATPAEVGCMVAERVVRLGTYGDPAAVPVEVWDALIAGTAGHTGYTHQWRTADALRSICMASVDSEQEYAAAIALGWRTFRVRCADAPMLAGEIACPASEEMGKRTVCADCRLCAGASLKAKTISIIAHGTGKRNFAAV